MPLNQLAAPINLLMSFPCLAKGLPEFDRRLRAMVGHGFQKATALSQWRFQLLSGKKFLVE